MWKKTAVSLLIFSQFNLAYGQSDVTGAEQHRNTTELAQPEQTWQMTQSENARQRLVDRDGFLQLESLLNRAVKQKIVSPQLVQLAQGLVSADYPLQEELAWLILNAKLNTVQLENVEQIVQDIFAFTEQFPQTAKRRQLTQRPFALYFQLQNGEALLHYAERIEPVGAENQCRVLAVKYQMLLPKLNSEQADSASVELEKLLQNFDKLWQDDEPTAECAELEQKWLDSGLKTAEKVRKKAVKRFMQSAKLALTTLERGLKDSALLEWLSDLEKLRENPLFLQSFAEKQALDEWNQTVVLHAFPAFIKAQPENLSATEFDVYLAWAEKFQLSPQASKQWQVAFLNRAFDNTDSDFVQWRDRLITELQVDSLTERRLRMAIWQKTDQKKWLALLSAEGRSKQEWRYWLAKNDPQQRDALLTTLSQERGFYSMLAAHSLGKDYQITVPNAPLLTQEQQANFQKQLDRIAELRALKRVDSAKLVWIDLLQAVNFEQKLALSHYALHQHWYDLAVEGTIQAKAWDYLSLRLPNAYADWFNLNLQGTAVSPTFAMAIARQESAWNTQARSHANAIGLMQMLPSTAKQTAGRSGLPFEGEQDLLQPLNNILLGTAHLQELNGLYPNNRILISAAYNAGAHRVAKWLERAGGKLAMDEFIASIPFLETRGYVQNVLAYDYYYRMLQSGKASWLFTTQEERRY